MTQFSSDHSALWDWSWDSQQESIPSLGWCIYLMHWHMECWVNTFFFHRPVSVTLTFVGPVALLSRQKDLYPTSFIHRSPLFTHFLYRQSIFSLSNNLHRVKYLQLFLMAVMHPSVLAVMSSSIVSTWRTRHFADRWFNWLCVVPSDVALMDRWLRKERLWVVPRTSHAKSENSAYCQLTAVNHSPSATTAHDWEGAVVLILQSWCRTHVSVTTQSDHRPC